MFIAEAPGRLGAEISGIPLSGDRTGDRFDQLLAAMNWDRTKVFITNAVLCNPRDGNGHNDAPRHVEIANCSSFLRRTISVVDPKLVVALGRVALDALNLIEGHSCQLRSSVGQLVGWYGRQLGVLYHPGPRTVVHRSWNQQVEDARKLACKAGQILGRSAAREGPVASQAVI